MIQDTKDYISEAQHQLSDEDFYLPLAEDPTPEYRGQAYQCVKNDLKTANSSECMLVPDNPRVSKFYLLPKIHKLPQMVKTASGAEESDVQKVIQKARD